MTEEMNERQRGRETRRLARRYANRPQSLEVVIQGQSEDGTALELLLYQSDGSGNYSMGEYLGQARFVTGGTDPLDAPSLEEEPEKLDTEDEQPAST